VTSTSNKLYFFALPTENGLEIDAIGSELSDSHRFEKSDVEAGLVAWDESGRSYRFFARQPDAGAAWEMDGWTHRR
jgi:hypothetical protein